MRPVAILTLITVTFSTFGAASGGDKAGPLTIEYHGQSFFIITTTKGKRIAIDPHTVPAYYPTGIIPLKKADIVLVTHNHNDHVRTEVFERNKENKNLKIIRGLKGPSLKADWADINETIGDIKISNVKTYHDDREGFERGKNSAFIIEVDGWRIVHLGDLGHLLTPKQLKQLGTPDVLMIPVGGIYTLNGADAKKVVAQLKPKEYVFPMHYGTKVFEDILPVDEFLDGQDQRHVVRLSDTERDEKKRENTIKLNRDAGRPRPLIVELHYWEREMAEEKVDEKKKK